MYIITLVTNTTVAESVLFVRSFKAAHDLTSWPSGKRLATKPENLDRFAGAHLFSVDFFFLFFLAF